jgi:hypothetical protein
MAVTRNSIFEKFENLLLFQENCLFGLHLNIILPAFVFAKSMTRSLMPFLAAGFDLLSFNCTLILLIFNF